MIAESKNRRGLTLIELTASMAVGSAMMAIATSVIYLLFSIHRDTREHLRERTSIARLGDHFRDDVHAATALAPVEMPAPGGQSGPAWELQLPGGRIVRYGVEQGDLRRADSAGGKPQHESFRLTDDAAVTIEPAELGNRTIVSLRIFSPTRPAGKPRPDPVQIDAILASDHRFTSSEEP